MKIIEKKESEEKWKTGDVIKTWNNDNYANYFMIINAVLPEISTEMQYGLIALKSKCDEAGTLSIDGWDTDLEFGLCTSIYALKVCVKEAWQNVKKVELEMREI